MKQSNRTMSDDDSDDVDLGVSSARRQSKKRGTIGRSGSLESITEYVIKDLRKDSKFWKENKTRSMPSFRKEELELGTVLGQGEFGCIHELTYFRRDELLMDCDSISSSSSNIRYGGLESDAGDLIPREVIFHPETDADGEGSFTPECRRSLRSVVDDQPDADNKSSSSSQPDNAAATEETETIKNRMFRYPMREGKARYAVKKLRHDVRRDIRPNAIVDLACEAEILTRLQHPNIIRLRGTSGVQGSSLFMLIMDRLSATLADKIDDWAVQLKHLKGSFLPGRLGKRAKEGLTKLFQERLLAAYDVARALRHLHDKRLLFRDIKPENVGLDPRGAMRLFDFGLCKELKAKDLVIPPDSYNATGLTGSRRYMAPEVVRCIPYGFSADVYAFGILFWQIFALETPFRGYDLNKHFEQVVLKGKRPRSIHLSLQNNKLLHHMMEECWSEDPKRRPRFISICQLLQSGLTTVEENNPAVLERTQYLMDRSLKSASA